MDYVIPILAIFITLSFLLKVGFYPRWGTWLTALCCALFVLLITPWVTEQSKTAIATFFTSREKMLDVSVCITLEAAILITFCFDCFSGMRTRDTAFKRSVTFLLHLYPGLLIGGVLCYVLAELLFSFPGSVLRRPHSGRRCCNAGFEMFDENLQLRAVSSLAFLVQVC